MRTCDIVGPVHVIEIRSISRDEHHAASKRLTEQDIRIEVRRDRASTWSVVPMRQSDDKGKWFVMQPIVAMCTSGLGTEHEAVEAALRVASEILCAQAAAASRLDSEAQG